MMTEIENEINTEKIKIPEKQESIRNPDGTFRKGFSGNLKGRPKGQTLKEYAREYFSKLTDEEKHEFLNGLSKDIIWKMAEGLPQQDITSGGEKLIPVPILNGISSNTSSQQNIESEKEDKNNSRGNECGKNDSNRVNTNRQGSIGSDTNIDEHSIGELSTPQEGSNEGLSEHNENPSILSGIQVE